MKRRTVLRIGLALMVLAAVQGLGATWWWAVHDMSSRVGMAHSVTTVVLGFAGFSAALFSELVDP